MEWLDDAKACLVVANGMLEEVSELQELAFQNNHYIPFFKVKIKNFMENCRSPLDYTAQYVFDTYCKSEYSGRERRKIKVYFPVEQSKEKFDQKIRNHFRSLSHKNPDILVILEEAQSFNDSTWLKELNRMVNKNKHRELGKHQKQRTTFVDRMVIGTNVFTNSTLVNVGTDITVNDTPYNFGDPNLPSEIEYDNAFVSNEFLFTDLSKPVIPTLREIHAGTSKVIREIEELI